MAVAIGMAENRWWFGGRQRPRYSPEGWPDMTPRDSPLLIWVGNSEQPARRGTEDSRSCRFREQGRPTHSLSVRPIPPLTDSWFHTPHFCLFFFFLLNGHPANHRCLFNPPVSAMGLCPVRPGTPRCCVDASSRLQQRHFSVLGSRIRFILQK